MTQRKDRIRVHIDGKEFGIVGGTFQELLAAVKQINGRRFVSELKVWQLPGPVEDIQRKLDFGGYYLEGGVPVSDKALQEIAQWISEQQDGINYGEVVKSLLARDYPEFREWLQKRCRG